MLQMKSENTSERSSVSSTSSSSTSLVPAPSSSATTTATPGKKRSGDPLKSINSLNINSWHNHYTYRYQLFTPIWVTFNAFLWLPHSFFSLSPFFRVLFPHSSIVTETTEGWKWPGNNIPGASAKKCRCNIKWVEKEFDIWAGISRRSLSCASFYNVCCGEWLYQPILLVLSNNPK